MEELKPCQSFKRFTHTYEDGKAWMPVAGITFMGEGELVGAPIDRLALYESLLQMEPAEAALKLRRAEPENKVLTLEQLRRMDKKYVRYVRYTPAKMEPPDKRYENVKVDCYDGSAYSDDMLTRLFFEDYGKTWLAYVRKPEGSTSDG